MTANYQLEMTLMGEESDIKKMLEVCSHYSKRGNREAYFNFVKLNDKSLEFGDSKIDLEIITDELVADLLSSGEVRVKADGPYGGYGELNDVGLFREMAEAAPNAKFVAEISGVEQYNEQNLKCCLEDGKLYITTFFMSNFEAGEAWQEDFKKRLPLKQFMKLFAVYGEEFNKESYGYVVEEFENIFRDGFESVEFDDFVSTIEENDGETELDEERFKEIMENELPALQICDPEEFEELYDGGETKEYVYDPVAKTYEGKSRPLFAGKVVTDADDIPAAGVRVQGLDDVFEEDDDEEDYEEDYDEE